MGISYLGKDLRPGLRIYTSVYVKNECCVMRLCIPSHRRWCSFDVYEVKSWLMRVSNTNLVRGTSLLKCMRASFQSCVKTAKLCQRNASTAS